MLRLQLNAPIQAVVEFTKRVKSYVLGTQLSFLIDNYCDQYFEVVRYANKHLNVSFEPDCQLHEVISPILKILNNQRNSCDRSEIQTARMKPFLRAVISNDLNLPSAFIELTTAQRSKLKALCLSLQETYNVFNSIAHVAPCYKDKDYFVIRRVHELSQNENVFSDETDDL